MAVKKSSNKATKKKVKIVKKNTAKKTAVTKKEKHIEKKFFDNFRFGESYTSLVYGVIAVIVAAILVLFFINTRQSVKPESNVVPTIADVEALDITLTPSAQTKNSADKTYTVVSGDSLWSISEKTYGTGYNWIDIARANNLVNPSQIFAGNKLVLPTVKLKDATVMTGENEAQVSRTVRIVDETYTVVKGDDLWNIAVRSYGDGYQWVKIAKANNLSNPDMIHPGNVLKIPRN